MSTKPKAAISWSGGKDGYAALARTRDDYDFAAMVTMVDESGARSRSHGLRPEVLAAQAGRLGLRRVVGRCTWETYTDTFRATLRELPALGVTHVVFGDIMFDEHRRWAERVSEEAGLTAVEPLWGLPTDQLFDEWVASGAEAIIVTARAEYLDETWLGRRLERQLLPDFVRAGVDPCGERGEYHTLVTDAPLFSAPLAWRRLGHVQRGGCWALDLEVDDAPRE